MFTHNEHEAHEVMMMNLQATKLPDDEDMPSEIDFSKGVRGKFYQPGMRLIPPVRLDPQVLNFLADRAQAKGTTINELLNALLKKDIELIQAA